jgi:hypothetical protein
MDARVAGAVLAAALLLAACGGSKTSAPPSGSAKTTTPELSAQPLATTDGPLPRGVVLTPGWKLVAQGEESGIRWFFSQGPVPQMGNACRSFDSLPPLRPSATGNPLVLGESEIHCSGQTLTLPSGNSSVHIIGSSSLVELDALRQSESGTFSAVAGVTAPGVDTVTVDYPDGTATSLRPSASHVFVVISRPAKPAPSKLSLRWPGGSAKCTLLGDEGGGISC